MRWRRCECRSKCRCCRSYAEFLRSRSKRNLLHELHHHDLAPIDDYDDAAAYDYDDGTSAYHDGASPSDHHPRRSGRSRLVRCQFNPS